MTDTSSSDHPLGYNARKAAHFTAALLKSSRHAIPMAKLDLLLYLSERRSLAMRQQLMFWDDLHISPRGPFCRYTHLCLKGKAELPTFQPLLKIIAKPSAIDLVRRTNWADTDELSADDIEIAEDIHQQFGRSNPRTILKWIRENCQEINFPTMGTTAISWENIACALYPQDPATMIARLDEMRGAVGAFDGHLKFDEAC